MKKVKTKDPDDHQTSDFWPPGNERTVRQGAITPSNENVRSGGGAGTNDSFGQAPARSVPLQDKTTFDWALTAFNWAKKGPVFYDTSIKT